ncbi:MAG: beta-galactosidase [Candidatus Omnitrophica bacterium]|nr:beta-galactosidase [Candidatus Omnitrophota bacterium]
MNQGIQCILRILIFLMAGLCSHTGFALDAKTETPFIYIIDYTPAQHRSPEFLAHFEKHSPDLYHPGADLRYLKGFGGSMNPMDVSFEAYQKQIQDFLTRLREKGVRWITPYLCIQTIIGNDEKRTGAWEVYDRWDAFSFLGLGPKPPELLQWMQREPSGNLHYNYKRMCFLGRGQPADRLRYAPCPNSPYWRDFCNNEARLSAQIGFDGFFIDNCIIHCYCQHCEEHFQTYLKNKYSLSQFQEAFGADDYSDIRLYAEGDARLWARTFPEFIPWLEKKYPPEKRRIPFDTVGSLDPVHVDNAGGGMLTGETAAFLSENVLQPGVQPTFENVRLENPALHSRIGRLRWAETMMFWSASIGDMLSEMREAGRRENPDFFLMPNWGTMQRVIAAAGRAEDGHDMKRWKTGGEWQMFEEGFTTGRIAPGLLLDYDMELRFAFANGVRAMHLPYKMEGRDIEEVALAETAASGGGVLVDTFHDPEIQKKYQIFFREHSDLYDGYHASASVALAHLFDQVYYLNVEHIRMIHALNRYLADQQIPFEHIIEEDLTAEALSRYQVVILPNTAFLSDQELDALEAFSAGGGMLILIRECGAYDMLCRPRNESGLMSRLKFKGAVFQFEHLSDALPHDGIFFEPGIQAAHSGEMDMLPVQTEFRKYAFLAQLDKDLWFKRYLDPGPLTPLIAKALSRNPHLTDPWEASGVRHRMYDRRKGTEGRIVVHLVNKNVPLAASLEERNLMPVENLELNIPIQDRVKVTAVYEHVPGREDRAMQWEFKTQNVVSCTLERLDAYAVISIDYSMQ